MYPCKCNIGKIDIRCHLFYFCFKSCPKLTFTWQQANDANKGWLRLLKITRSQLIQTKVNYWILRCQSNSSTVKQTNETVFKTIYFLLKKIFCRITLKSNTRLRKLQWNVSTRSLQMSGGREEGSSGSSDLTSDPAPPPAQHLQHQQLISFHSWIYMYRVAKCKFSYTEQNLQTKFYPKKST